MDHDADLFAWIRHYGALILVFVVLGGVAGFLYTTVVPRRTEAWTLVVENGAALPPRQVGAVGQAIFHSSAVYAPAMRRLGITESPLSFLAEDVALQPIPNTNTLVVVGKARRLEDAARISNVMASAFVDALRAQRRGFNAFSIFGSTQPAPVREGVSRSVAVVVIEVAGFWVGFAVSGLHYRYRRPVLSMEPAVVLTGANGVIRLRSRLPRWLGVLGGRPRWRRVPIARDLPEDAGEAAPRAVLVAPGLTARRRRALARSLGYETDPADERVAPRDPFGQWVRRLQMASDPVVVLCRPATDRRELEMLGGVRRTGDASVPLELLWLD